MAHEAGNIDGSHIILTADLTEAMLVGKSVQLLLAMIGRFPKVTFVVRFVLYIVSSPL